MDKKDVDYEPGYVWKFNYKKFAGLLIFFAIILFIAYAFMRSDTGDFLRTALVYAIIGLIAFAIAFIVFGAAKAAYTKLKGYFIAVILVFAIYVVLGYIMDYALNLQFSYNYGAWVLILTLAGFHKIDGKFDSRDVFYGVFVFLAIIFANLPLGVGGKTPLQVLTYLVNKVFQIIGILKSHHISWNWNETKGIVKLIAG